MTSLTGSKSAAAARRGRSPSRSRSNSSASDSDSDDPTSRIRSRSASPAVIKARAKSPALRSPRASISDDSGSDTDDGRERKRTRRRADSDPDHVEHVPDKARPRAAYASAFDEVATAQNLKRTDSGGHYQYDSVFNKGKKNIIGLDQKESIAQKPKAGKARPPLRRRPALDHKIQYAALELVHDERIYAERKKASAGQARRYSVDFADAFSAAVKDPKNLRLVSHKEHVAHGGSSHKSGISDAEKKRAAALLDKHMPASHSPKSAQDAFELRRYKWHTPLDATGASTRTRINPPRKSRKH